MSGVTCHVSCVRCHMSQVMCHNYYFLYIVVKLVGRGSIIKRASPPSFFDSTVQFATCKKLLLFENVCFVHRKSEPLIEDCLIVVMKILVTMVGSLERQTETKIKKLNGWSQ